MKIIGLTGSIGMGKSVTAGLLRQMGIAVHDSDACVHQLLSPGQKAYDLVIQRFHDIADPASGQIDRKKLGELVFPNPAHKRDLEAILHPLVQESQRDFIAREAERGSEAVILDIPLLYETGADTRCDAVICVTAPYILQRARVLKRPNMTPEKFAQILSQQMPDAEKRKRADFIVQTWLGRGFTRWQLKKILHKLQIYST